MIKKIFSSFVFQGISFVTSILNSILITRILGVEDKGIYAVTVAFISISTIVLNFGTPSALTYFISNNKINKDKILKTVLLFIITISVVFLLVIRLVYYFEFSFLPAAFFERKIFFLAFIWFFINNIFSVINSFFYGIGKVTLFNKIGNFMSLIITIILILVYYKYRFQFDNLIVIFSVLVSVKSVFIIIYYFSISNNFNLKTRGLLDKKELKMFFLWSITAYFANIFQFLNYKIDFWIVNIYEGIRCVGIYSLSSNINQMLWLLPNSIAVVVFPYISKKIADRNSIDNVLKMTRILTLALLFIVIVALASSQYLIPVLYGRDFTDAIVPFNILLISITPFGIITVLASYLAGMNKQKVNLLSSLYGLIATIVFDILLIPRYGIIGAAIASSISYLITSFYILFYICNKYNVRIFDIFIIKRNDFVELIKMTNVWKN